MDDLDVLDLLTTADAPLSEREIAAELGADEGKVYAAVVRLRRAGAIADAPNLPHSYIATDSGLTSAATTARDRLAEEVSASLASDVAAVVASFDRVADLESRTGALIASFNSLHTPDVRPQIRAAITHLGEARRYESGRFAGGRSRALAARRKAAEAVADAALALDPSWTGTPS